MALYRFLLPGCENSAAVTPWENVCVPGTATLHCLQAQEPLVCWLGKEKMPIQNETETTSEVSIRGWGICISFYPLCNFSVSSKSFWNKNSQNEEGGWTALISQTPHRDLYLVVLPEDARFLLTWSKWIGDGWAANYFTHSLRGYFESYNLIFIIILNCTMRFSRNNRWEKIL